MLSADFTRELEMEFEPAVQITDAMLRAAIAGAGSITNGVEKLWALISMCILMISAASVILHESARGRIGRTRAALLIAGLGILGLGGFFSVLFIR
jgi:hypothetical protein